MRAIYAAAALAAFVAAPAARAQLADRSGPAVVKEQCAKCHQAGAGGAPKIGDMEAWRPRLKNGLDTLVRYAIRGHGGMPPRGNRADLTDAEVRSAILTMITPPAAAQKQGAAKPPAPSTLTRSVDGLDMNLGLVPAETLRLFPEGAPERAMHGGIPSGSGYYHLNVSLADAASKTPIGDAKVEVRLERPGASGASATLQPVTINNAPSYGGYVRLQPKSAYRIVVQVRKPGAAAPVEARFEHRTR